MKDKHIALEVSQDEHYRGAYLKSLKESWPSLARDYRHYCKQNHPKTGDIWTWTSPEGQMFFHLVLDESERGADAGVKRLQAFRHAVKKMKKAVENSSVKLIELPEIGFQFNSDELELAKSILKEVFSDSQSEIKFV